MKIDKRILIELTGARVQVGAAAATPFLIVLTSRIVQEGKRKGVEKVIKKVIEGSKFMSEKNLFLFLIQLQHW